MSNTSKKTDDTPHTVQVILDEVASLSPSQEKEEKVRALAYDLWLQRGAPDGAPEADWFAAERLTP
jgi:hypothetical protein